MGKAPSTLVGAVKENISVPMVALAVAIGAALYAQPTPAKTLATEGAGSCQSEYCQPAQMFVDKPKNTELKDQSLGVGLSRPDKLPGPAMVHARIQRDLMREQLLSPGVNLVAHTVA